MPCTAWAKFSQTLADADALDAKSSIAFIAAQCPLWISSTRRRRRRRWRFPSRWVATSSWATWRDEADEPMITDNSFSSSTVCSCRFISASSFPRRAAQARIGTNAGAAVATGPTGPIAVDWRSCGSPGSTVSHYESDETSMTMFSSVSEMFS